MTGDVQGSFFDEELPDFMDEGQFEKGTAIRTFNIIKTTSIPEGYKVLLNLETDSGYELEGARMVVTHEDLAAYETKDVKEAVKNAFGFFE